MTCDLSLLNQHLTERIRNHEWLSQCLEGKKESFPYRLNQQKTGKVEGKYHYAPQNKPDSWPDCKGLKEPTYLLNIPSTAKYASILDLLQNQAFGTSDRDSQSQVKKRLTVVIGMNRAYSLDKQRDRVFLRQIHTAEKVEGIAYRLMGFFWTPVWQAQNNAHLYSPSKSFLLLKALSEEKASCVLAFVEAGDLLKPQVPYKEIRQYIKDSAESRSFANHFQNEAPDSFTYFGLMDDDTLALRDSVGLLSRIDKVIIESQAPSVITCGYQVKEIDRPILALAVRLDMAVRSAMNSQIPYSAYFPEPGSFFCIRRPPGSHFLDELTFRGDGAALESRRLIQNGRKKKLFDDRAVFLSEGGLLTTTPERMKSLKSAKFTEIKIKEKGFLQSLRGASQTHATPKQWADNLYIALDFKTSLVTDATTLMMQLFNVFDPISRMFDLKGRFSTMHFDMVINTYDAPLSTLQNQKRLEAREKLAKLKMSEDEIEAVERAARSSGQAILTVLTSV